MINNPATTPSSGNPNMNPFDAQTTSRPATTSQTIIASLSQPDTTDPSDTTGRYSLARQRQDRINKKHRLPFSKEAKLPKFLTDRGKVMSFSAYFEEEVRGQGRDARGRQGVVCVWCGAKKSNFWCVCLILAFPTNHSRSFCRSPRATTRNRGCTGVRYSSTLRTAPSRLSMQSR